MSRIGKLPIPIPSGVTVKLTGSHCEVTGPKGVLKQDFEPTITITVNENEIVVSRPSDKAVDRAKHGLTRALLNNMVIGVTNGYSKELKILGVGYRASLQGANLNLALGFSHPVTVEPPEGISFEVPDANTIKVSGINKQQVGQAAANIRAWRKPEPYKGKGIRYADEYVRRKVGKAGVK